MRKGGKNESRGLLKDKNCLDQKSYEWPSSDCQRLKWFIVQNAEQKILTMQRFVHSAGRLFIL